MKKCILFLSVFLVINSCKQPKETKAPQVREEIKLAKELLSQAETEARADIMDIKKYEDANALLTIALEKNNRE